MSKYVCQIFKMTSEFVLNVKTQIFFTFFVYIKKNKDNNNAISAYLCKYQC